MEWLLQAPVLVFSVIAHEVAHGYTAFRCGDDTAYLSGRLTFNPLPHIDPFGTVLVPLVCIFTNMPVIGWARPVPVNTNRLDNPRKDMTLVSFSGPATNFLLAAVSFLLWKLTAYGFAGMLTFTLLKVFQYGIIINLALGFFNLIPVFPLDGSHIVSGLMPWRWLEIYERHFPYGMYIIMGLAFTGFIKYLIWPPMLFVLTLLTRLGFVPM